MKKLIICLLLLPLGLFAQDGTITDLLKQADYYVTQAHKYQDQTDYFIEQGHKAVQNNNIPLASSYLSKANRAQMNALAAMHRADLYTQRANQLMDNHYKNHPHAKRCKI